MQSPTENPKELSEIEVARLERLIRRMSDFQRGGMPSMASVRFRRKSRSAGRNAGRPVS